MFPSVGPPTQLMRGFKSYNGREPETAVLVKASSRMCSSLSCPLPVWEADVYSELRGHKPFLLASLACKLIEPSNLLVRELVCERVGLYALRCRRLGNRYDPMGDCTREGVFIVRE